LKSILVEVLENDSPDARRAALKHLCADDADLLSDAESLLAEAEILVRDRFDPLEACAEKMGRAIPRHEGPVIGQRIGSYVVIGEIGRGGMGTLYLAARADGYFEKQVAVKVLNWGDDSEELLRRFRAEHEVLARLDHPNIARLIDAGTTNDGLPYFIMEYVEGVAITRFVEINNASISRRLDLFLKVCDAVEAAHECSIVHRDLKSTNILVDRKGEPKLLDFGIAKVVGRERNSLEVTASGNKCLTPVSASPEQVQGEPITISTDIYALGIVLYEMLTGSRAHRFVQDTPSAEQLRDVVCKQLPVPPSQAVKDRSGRLQLQGDLDAIVLKALQKEPAHRYRSVVQFAEDIRSHLAGKSVRARENNKAYRLRSLFRRNRRVHLFAAAALFIAFVSAAFFLGSGLHSKRSDAQNSNIVSTPEGESFPAKSIAVLPFDTFNNDQASDYFSDGVQEAILTSLANVNDLKVISRASVANYRGKPRNEREIGRNLGVSYVLEGSVQKDGDRVRVNTHLIDARTLTEVWAQQYDRKFDDLLAVESDLAQAIASQLQAKLSPAEKAVMEIPPTTDMVAYDLYLRGRESFFQNNCENALDLLQQAIVRDPQFLLARFSLAQVELFLYRYNDHTPQRLSQAQEAVETALRLAPNLPQSHLAKAQYSYYCLRDYEQALRELKTLRSTGADAAQFYDLAALAERRLGHWKDAVRDGEKAVELDPRNPFVVGELLNSYIAVRRFNDAIQLADKAIGAMATQDAYILSLKSQALLNMGQIQDAVAVLENSPAGIPNLYQTATFELFARNFSRASEVLGNASLAEKESYTIPLLHGTLARAQHDATRAKSFFQIAHDRLTLKLRERADDPELISSLAVADAALGLKQEALDYAKRAGELCAISRDAVDGPTYRLVLAQVYAWTGQVDEALAELANIVKVPQGPSYGELRFNPAWDEIHADPRFETLLTDATRPPLLD
jgi:serine/threonine protein kinase/tetratricopeptide (TPR) repeat protein